VTEQEIELMRSRIAELEKSDADFARKSNLLLDEILLTRDQIDQMGISDDVATQRQGRAGRRGMSEIPGVYNVGISRPQPPPSFDEQLKALPPAVRSVADSLAQRDMEGAKRYVAQYLSANRGVRL